MEYPQQSAIRRAINNTVSAQKSARFMWGGEGVLAVAGGAWLQAIAPVDTTTLEIIARSVVGGLIGLSSAILLILAWNLIRAPYKQRNEARDMVRQLRRPSDSEVTDVIRLLEAETLTFRSNDEEEHSYSFAQVFLAIAHQLSIGISSIYFDEKVRKELAIDANEEWYLPYEDEGITHLIALLHQNTLINRSDEEHQHMVPDYSQGLTTLANPRFLPEKSIEAKYSLSPFGVTVVQQLRKQLISHKVGSQT